MSGCSIRLTNMGAGCQLTFGLAPVRCFQRIAGRSAMSLGVHLKEHLG